MTVEEFIQEMRETSFKWDVVDGLGAIRTKKRIWTSFFSFVYLPDHCPITAVYMHKIGQRMRIGSAREAGSMIGLSSAGIDEIMDAADNRRSHDPELRKQLLEAVGLA